MLGLCCCEGGAFSSCGEQELPSNCVAWDLHRRGFSCCGAHALEAQGFSSHGMWLSSRGMWLYAQALEHRLNSCGPQA